MAGGMQSDRQAETMAIASKAFAQGRLDLADRICRELHESGLATWQSWLLVAEVAAKVARADVASDAIENAARLPGAESGRLDAVRRRLESIAPPVTGGVLVIRSWGQGFWSDVDHVLGQLLLAEITGRTPLVHWGANSRYGGAQLARGRHAGESDPACNIWDHFFKPVSSLCLADVVGRGHAYFPSKWNDANLTVLDNGSMSGLQARRAAVSFLNRGEAVAVSDFYTPLMALRHWLPPEHRLFGKRVDAIYLDLIARYLTPNDEIAARLSVLERTLDPRPVIAVHVRGSDKYLEVPHLVRETATAHQHIESLCAKLGRARVLLLTDWKPAVDEYRARYGDRVMLSGATTTSSGVGMHFQPALDGRNLGTEVLLDTLLASRCDAFVGTGHSNVSIFMDYFGRLRPAGWTDETAILLGPHVHHGYWRELLMPR